MSAPYFGIDFLRMDDEARPVWTSDLSTVGIIGPAPGANPTYFPLNTPVKMESDDALMAGYLGTQGYIPDAIRALNDQLAETQFAARVVVVRTAEGVSLDPTIKAQQTIANIVGSSLTGTGIWAFLKAPHVLGFSPRLLLAPGYTGQMANGVGVCTQTVNGNGYHPGSSYEVIFSGGGDNAVQATGHAIATATGALGPVVLDTPGAWYETAPAIAAENPPAATPAQYTVTIDAGLVTSVTVEPTDKGNGYTPGEEYDITISGVGSGAVVHAVADAEGSLGNGVIDNPGQNYVQGTTSASPELPPAPTAADYTCTIVAGANPVCASFTSVCNQLLAHAIIESTGTSQQNDSDWRETMQSQRLIALSGGIRVMDVDDPEGDIVFRPLAPRMAGIIIRRDHETGAPFHSAANQPIQGIIGPARDIAFALTDGANEAQELLSMNIGVVVRGEVGNEFAIASGGFVLISTDTLSEDPLWQFYNVSRGRDFIHLGLLRTLRFYLGRFNIVGHTVQAILNTMGFFLRDLQADDHILGYRVNFRSAGNSAEEIRQGHLTIGFKAEEPPVLRRITTESYRYRPAIEAMVADLEAQLNLAA